MDLETRLRPITLRLDSAIRGLTFVQANALFREYVREYQATIVRLEKLVSADDVNTAAVVLVARRMCELSREIIFAVNGRKLPGAVKSLLSNLYGLSVELLDDFPASSSLSDDEQAEFGNYRDNIDKRSHGDDPWESLDQALANDSWDAKTCLLYTSPSPRDRQKSRMPSSA